MSRVALLRIIVFAVMAGTNAPACVHDWDAYEPRGDAASPDVASDTTTTDVPCTAPLENCNGVCVDLSNDIAHCGSCVRRCRRGTTCAMGSCQ